MFRALAPLLLGLMLLSPAAAQPAEPCANLADPRLLVEEGLRLYKSAFGLSRPAAARDRFEQSLRCYERAIERSQSPGKIYHPLGLVYEKLDRPADALIAYERFLREVPEAERSQQVSQKLREKIDQLRAQQAPPGPAEPAVVTTPVPAPLPAPVPIALSPPRPRTEPRLGLIIAGSSLFTGAYLLSIIGGALCDPYSCGPLRASLYVPLIGPFIEMGSYQDYEDRSAVLAVLFLDGFVQISGVAMVVLGAVFRRPVPAFSLRPQVGGAAFTFSGTF